MSVRGGSGMTGRMRVVHPRILAAWVGVVSAGAALTAGACATGGPLVNDDSLWREDMGLVSSAAWSQGLNRVLRKYALQLYLAETHGADLYYETGWETRELLAHEEAGDVTAARNRIVFRGRSVGRDYQFSWELQNEVTTVADENWHPGPLPDEVKEEYNTLYRELLMEIRVR